MERERTVLRGVEQAPVIDAFPHQLCVPVGVGHSGLRRGRGPYLALQGADSRRTCTDLPRLAEPALVLRGLFRGACFTRALQVCVFELARSGSGASRVAGDLPQLGQVELGAVV